MKNIANPGQNDLFDIFESFLSPVAYKKLTTGFHAVFRHVILALMPAEELGVHFHEEMGRPTKELYSMAGLVLLKEFYDWTTEEAASAYMFDTRVQYALGLGRDNISFCTRTLERYMRLVREDSLAIKIFDDVAIRLVEELDIRIDKQRLDSTHIFSDMATFTRTKLMGVTIKRFLVQLSRHHKPLYEALPEEILQRYKKKENALFADVAKKKEERAQLRTHVAEQMYWLIQHFSGNNKIESMTSFKHLVTVFSQQCEVIDEVEIADHLQPDSTDNSEQTEDTELNEDIDEEEVAVKKKTGGNVIQNPSDPDATYDGHKGPGYQVQITETCNPDNAVQIITSAIPQTAVTSDMTSLNEVLDDLNKKDVMPNEILADGGYGSDGNAQAATQNNATLTSPVAGPQPANPAQNPSEKQKRLEARRAKQSTDEWRKNYNTRAQIEGTIGSIKRRTGMVRLRYRGQTSIFTSVYLKLAGWNISRAAASKKFIAKLSELIGNSRSGAKNQKRKGHIGQISALPTFFEVPTKRRIATQAIFTA